MQLVASLMKSDSSGVQRDAEIRSCIAAGWEAGERRRRLGWGGLPLQTRQKSRNPLKATQEPVGGNLPFFDLCPVDDGRLASAAF